MKNHFLFFGDFVCQTPSRLVFSEEIKDLIELSEIVYCNFEAPIKGYGLPISKSGPSLTQSSDSPAILESNGFNLIGVANNHMMDMGREGCEATIKAFKKARVLGAGRAHDAYQIEKIQTQMGTLGFISLTHREFGVLDVDNESYGTAWINHPRVNKLIQNAAGECDYLIVLPHAGVENISVPLPEWRERYKEFIDLGAKAVIASHPHVPQGWEVYKNCPIFYSLGNFIFDSFSSSHSSSWFKGLAVALTPSNDGYLCFEVYNTNYQDGVLSLDSTKLASENNKSLLHLLNDNESYNGYINKAVSELWRDEYQLCLLRGLGSMGLNMSLNMFLHSAYGLLKGMDRPMLLNILQCESHRWAIERYLKNNLK